LISNNKWIHATILQNQNVAWTSVVSGKIAKTVSVAKPLSDNIYVIKTCNSFGSLARQAGVEKQLMNIVCRGHACDGAASKTTSKNVLLFAIHIHQGQTTTTDQRIADRRLVFHKMQIMPVFLNIYRIFRKYHNDNISQDILISIFQSKQIIRYTKYLRKAIDVHL